MPSKRWRLHYGPSCSGFSASIKGKGAYRGDLRKMLGFCLYYRSYIQNYSRIAKLIYQLLSAFPDNTRKRLSQRQPHIEHPHTLDTKPARDSTLSSWLTARASHPGISRPHTVFHPPFWTINDQIIYWKVYYLIINSSLARIVIVIICYCKMAPCKWQPIVASPGTS